MAFLPSHLESKSETRHRSAGIVRSLSGLGALPSPASLRRSPSPAFPPRSGSPSRTAGNGSSAVFDLDDSDADSSHLYDVSGPSTPGSPVFMAKTIPYKADLGSRRRSAVVATGGLGRRGLQGWLERAWKLYTRRGWTKKGVFYRAAGLIALMCLVTGLFRRGERLSLSPDEYNDIIDDAQLAGRSKHALGKAPTFPVQMDEDDIEDDWNDEGAGHEFTSDGYLRMAYSSGARHPVWDLVEEASHRYQALMTNHPYDEETFVKTYVMQHQKQPPPGYESLYPHLAHIFPYSPLVGPSAFHLYNSVAPSRLHERQFTSEAFYALHEGVVEPPLDDEDAGRFVLVVREGVVWAEWPWNGPNSRSEKDEPFQGQDFGLVARVRKWLKDPEWKGKIGDMRITIDLEDHNPQIIPHDYLVQAAQRAEHGHIESDNGRFRRPNSTAWSVGCGHSSPLTRRQSSGFSTKLKKGEPRMPRFIHSPHPATDICLHPRLAAYSEIIAHSPHGPLEVDTRPVPQLSNRAGLGRIGGEILTLGVGPEGAPLALEDLTPVPWNQKMGGPVFWRGPSPEFHSELTPSTAARLSTHYRLALLPTTPINSSVFPLTLVAPSNNHLEGAREAGNSYQPVDYSFAVDIHGKSKLTNALWDRGAYIDVAFRPGDDDGLDCNDLRGCKELTDRVRIDGKSSDAVAGTHKYVFVLEGEDPRRAFESGSLVFHVSAVGLSAWQTKAIPWHDYIPISADFSDLPSIIEWLRANDAQAARIASNGREFAKRILSAEAGEISLVGALLEWSRVWGRLTATNEGSMNG